MTLVSDGRLITRALPPADAVTLTSDNFSLIPLDRALDAGAMVGPFRVQHLIERGVRASSYAAEWAGGGEGVTVRIYAPELCVDSARVLRFVQAQEALTQHGLRGSPALLDHGQLDDGRLWIATERLRGASLADRLRASSVARAEADRLLIEVARTLSAAHELSVFHGDLRLEDVFLVEREGVPDVRVLDVGASLLLDRAPTSLRVAAAADVQGLGKIAFRLWVGRELDDARDLMPQPAGRARYEGVPVEEERFLLALLSPDPNLRPSLTEARAWLAASGDGRATAPRGVPSLEPPAPAPVPPRSLASEPDLAPEITIDAEPGAPEGPPESAIEDVVGVAPRRRRWLLLPLLGALAGGAFLVARPRPPAPAPVVEPAPPAHELPAPTARPSTPVRPAAPAVLTLEIGERHARAWIDGAPRPIVDGQLRVEGAGRHRIRITARDCISFDREIQVEEGQVQRLAVTLSKKRGPRDLNYLVDPFGSPAR